MRGALLLRVLANDVIGPSAKFQTYSSMSRIALFYCCFPTKPQTVRAWKI